VIKNLITLMVLTWLLCLTPQTLAAKASVPPSLSSWTDWVLKDHQQLNCPFINGEQYGELNSHICAWPSELKLDISQRSASFKQSWRVLTTSTVSLPGNNRHWPLQITVNQKSVPVINKNGRPVLILEPGNHTVEGHFTWPQPPQTIGIPDQFAVINMTIDGNVVAFPKLENNELWLQQLKPTKEIQDSIEMVVVRRVADGAYIRLDTDIVLNVSGKVREVALGEVLPKGFELIAIDSQMPAFIDGDGVLRAKLKPGKWRLSVLAYAQPTLLSWQRPPVSDQWPQDEVWVFKGNENLRQGKLSGAQMVDNSQVRMPRSWTALPSYLVTQQTVLNYDIQHRGKPLHLENQLQLNRTMWLSFDYNSYSVVDELFGTMLNDWRLTLNAPYQLESANDPDGPVLVTTMGADERGLENRYSNVDIDARSTIAATSELAVTGWDNNFERVSILLNLPPGNSLFAVFGADYVSNSWWGYWTIWTSFIVLFISMITTRMISVVAGIVTAAMLLITFQNTDAPIIAMSNLLLAIAIDKHQPFEKMKAVVRGYAITSIVVAVCSILLFSALEIRSVLHPQLENNHISAWSFPTINDAEPAPQMLSKSSSQRNQHDTEMVQVTGSRVKAKKIERYQADAIMQAGSGVPDWEWNKYRIDWHSPVAKDQTFKLIVLSKNTNRVLKLTGVALIIVWLYLLLRHLLPAKLNIGATKAITSAALVLMILPLYSPPTIAGDLPNEYLLKQLESRLTEAPLCAPACATINTFDVVIDKDVLSLTLSVHAQANTAISLPLSPLWRPKNILINSQQATQLIRKKDWIYLPIKQGISTITLDGQVADVNTFQLAFKDLPKHVTVRNSTHWEIVGNKDNKLLGNALEFIATSPKRTESNSGTEVTTRYTYQPLVEVTRRIVLEQTWTVTTTVRRIAPQIGSINTKVAMLDNEQIISGDISRKNNTVDVNIPAGVNSISWQSTLPSSSQLQLLAPSDGLTIEHWRLVMSPSWHVEFSGLPVILDQIDSSEYYVYSFVPHPGETLTVDVTRPNAIKGQVLAIDSVDLNVNQGTRTSTLALRFKYRSTRGGEHIISLPQSYQLKEVKSDGKLINVQIEQGQLAIPILPGEHKVVIQMRHEGEYSWMFNAPEIDLNAPVSNIETVINVNEQRWVLWANGPLVGPAVLYWGELLVFILLALVASRIKFSPLNTLSWLALGFGLSLNYWGVLVLIVVWFSSLTAASRRPSDINRSLFNFSQLVLFALSIVAIACLIFTVPMSLLSSPSMGIDGNDSYGNHLRWFMDKSSGELPQISVVNISILFYKGIMLAWVIWLSFSVLNWLKWAWARLGEQGFWKSPLKNKPQENSEQR